MTRAHISVIIPVGGIDPSLDAQLEAVRGQATDDSFDIVVSVNSNVPDVRRWADAAAAGAGAIVVDSSQRRGAAHARNCGAAASTSELLAFCDADDLVHPGWLSALVRALADFDAVTGPVNEIAPPGQEHWRPPATPGRLPHFMGVPYILSGNLGIRRRAFESVGGFDETLTRCEDIALGWALQNKGFRLGYAPDAVLDYRHRAGLRSLLRQHYLYGRGMAEVLARYPKPGHGTNRLDRLRANGQPGPASGVAVLRRGATAAGRLRGLASR